MIASEKKKLLTAFMLAVSLSTGAIHAENITFSSGNTTMQMKGDNRIIKLSGGASITTGDVEIKAQTVIITGSDYSNLECDGNVSINDFKRRITIYSTSLIYNRQTQRIVVDGWIELQDLNNEVAASAAWLDFNMDEGVLKMQIRARIVKKTEKGPMICRADNITFNRDNNTLLLSGNSSVNWDGNKYSANNIQVDLKTEEIKMVGGIEGNITS